MPGFLSKTALFLLISSAAAIAAEPPRDIAPPIAITDSNVSTEDAPAEGLDASPVPISTAPVGKPSIEGFGTLEENKGGLPATVWKNSTRESAGGLLHQIRSGVADEVVLGLTTRLLMTEAAPPEGTGEDWFALRVRALIALGQDEKAEQLIAAVPASMTSDTLRQLQVELLLLRSDVDSACRTAATFASGRDPGDTIAVFWKKLAILCLAHAGKKEEAMVGMDVLHEESQMNDLFFQEAIRKMNDKMAVIKTFPKKWSLFDVELIRLAGDTDKLKEHFDALPPVTLKYLAQDTSQEIKFREKATLKAQQFGILPIKETNKNPELPFAKNLASDVTTLVMALGSGKPANEADNAVIARLALDEGVGIQDCRRVQRLLTLMEPFGYKVTPPIWQKLFDHKIRFDGEVPPAVLVARMNEAQQAGRSGEVVLFAALIMEGADTDKIPDLALLPIVKALKASGFEKEARALAFNAVKGYSGR